MGNGKSNAIAGNMGIRAAADEGRAKGKIASCEKAISRFVTQDTKIEGMHKAMETLNGEYKARVDLVKQKFEQDRDKVMAKRNEKIDEIKKNATVAVSGKDETERMEAEADVSIEAGKQMKVVLGNAKSEMGRINNAIYKIEKTERKKYKAEALSIAKEAIGTKDRIKEIAEAMGEIVGKAAYAVRNEPIKATAGTALVIVGIAVATGPVGIMTGIGAITAVYGASTLWKCGPAHVALKKLEQLRSYQEKSQ